MPRAPSIARLPDDAGGRRELRGRGPVRRRAPGGAAHRREVSRSEAPRSALDHLPTRHRATSGRGGIRELVRSCAGRVDRGSAPAHRIRDHRGISFRPRAGAASAAPAAKSSARPESASWHPDLAQPAGESRRGDRGTAAIVPAGARGHAGTLRPRRNPSISKLEIFHPPRSSAAGRCGCVVADST